MNRIGRSARRTTVLSALALAIITGGAGAASAGGGWTAQPFPFGHDIYEAESAVSCHGTSFCFSVGTTFPGFTRPDVLVSYQWTGSSWERVDMALPSSGVAIEFAGVSCPSASHCVAVGSYRPESDALPLAMAEYWTGMDWALLPVPAPVGHNWTEFNGVSCVSATWCVAVGGQSISLSALVEVWNRGGWRAVPTPNTGRYGDVLHSVSCVSKDFCIAVGAYRNGQGRQPLIETWDGASWAIQTAPVRTNTEDGVANGVSCAAVTACTAVISYTTASGKVSQILHWNGTAWKTQRRPTGVLGLDSVSCPATTSCTAVGHSGPGVPVVIGSTGSAWAVQATAISSGRLTSVSCPSAAFCMTVGYTSRAQGDRPRSEDS